MSSPETAEPRDLMREYERVKEVLEPFTQKLAVEMGQPYDHIVRLMIAMFSRSVDVTHGVDTLVLVVRGFVTPYDNATQVLVSGGPHSQEFEELAIREDP